MKYVSRPIISPRESSKTAHYRDYWIDDELGANAMGSVAKDVVVEESDTFTGLYDANGDALHRVKPTIGFIRD